jgi:methylenetetrahydrofolate dehydrogenase (NADP+) / methenyltetrahydrofolate cyclohydrolase
MKVNGIHIANRIYDSLKSEIATLARAPRLGIVTYSPNFETEKYLALKEKKAKAVGIHVEVVRLGAEAQTEDVLSCLEELILRTDGVVVQLPLPSHIDSMRVISAIPMSHDVDALNPVTTTTLSPVVGALMEILKEHSVIPKEKHVVIVGSGKLVGLPAYKWFIEQGAFVSVVTKDTHDISYYTRPADIVVLGAGVPGLLTPEMVKEGVVVLDAGTSEDGGELKGDADPHCEEKASLFTPVPGGIGPITIAVLLRNVLELAGSKVS